MRQVIISQEAKSAIIEALKEEQYEYEEGGDCYETIEDVIEIVESFPVSDGCNQSACATWIPVTERLPEEYGEYIVFYKTGNGKYEVGTLLYFVDFGFHNINQMTGDPCVFNEQVSHWQPLPTPPVTK